MIPIVGIAALFLAAPMLLEATGPLTARDMFYASASSAAPAEAPALGLRYAIQRKLLNGEWLEVSADAVFRSGDRIRLTVTSNAPGYLYIIQQGSSGSWTPLYPPADESAHAPRLEAGKSLILPEEGSFQFNDQPGTEALFLLFSREPLSSLPSSVPEPKTSGGALDDQAVTALRKVHSRDLVVEALDAPKAESLHDHGVYVVNRQTGKAKDLVVVDLKLQHR
jgi:hypothetical protein